MADDDKYNGSGFHQDGDGSVWGDPSVEGGESDYESWDWKQIKAAVVGGAAVPGDGGNRTLAISDPDSFFGAAKAFTVAQLTLSTVASNMRIQADSLVGEDRPWQGDAATSFHGMMEAFAAQLDSRADQIAGGASHTNPVPLQLWNNGQYLAWARDILQRLDEYYAAVALSRGAPKGNGGLVVISSQPDLVAALSRDMRSVIRLLAQNYAITVNELVPVDTSSFNQPPTPKDPPPPADAPPPPDAPSPTDVPPPPSTDLPNSPPSTDLPSSGGLPGGLPPSGLPGGEPPANLSALPPAPSGLNGPGGGDFPTSGGPQGLGGDSLPPFPDALTGPGAGNLPASSDPQGLGGSDLPAFPDGLTGPGAGELPPPDGLQGPAGSELSPPPLNSPAFDGPPAGLAGGLPAGVFGGLPSGTPSGLPGNKPGGLPDGSPPGLAADSGLPLPELSEPPPTEVSGADDGFSPVTGGLPGLDQGDHRYGTGMPGMPMSGSPGSLGAGGGGGAERPDAAGLLAGGPGAWDALAGPVAGDPVGSDTPAVTPADWAAGSEADATPGVPGMPMSPMSGSPGSLGAGGSGAERPDAAGLLAGGPEPWEAAAGPEVGDPVGSDTPAVTPAEWAAGSEADATPGVSGLPGMPMSGSPGTQAAGGGAERPDAAGLLAGGPEAWEVVAGPEVGDPVGSDTPAVTPAEWAAREPESQVVPGVPMMPMQVVAPPPTSTSPRRATSAPHEFEPVESEMDDSREKDGDPSFPFALPLAGPRSRRRDERERRVPVVSQADEEDFSAWDAPSPIFGGGLAQPAATAPSTTDVDELPARYRRGVNRPPEDTRNDDEPVLCGADEAPPVDEDPEDDTGDEEEPRTMADLLTLHNSAWSKENTAPSGVLD